MYSLSVGLGTCKIHPSPTIFQPQLSIPLRNFSLSTKFPPQKRPRNLYFPSTVTKRFHFYRTPYAIFGKTNANPKASENLDGVNEEKEDFVTRVLKENPSQVEPRFLIGNKLYTLKEKENLSKNSLDYGVLGLLKILNFKSLFPKTSYDGQLTKSEEEVYLKDILREYKGKLYVPEQIFGANLSEEEEFEKNVEELPKLNIEDFRKYMKSDKIRILTFKENAAAAYGVGYRDFVVELTEIPGEKNLQRTRWLIT